MDKDSENEECNTYCPFTLVFSNDLLRESILEYAIQEGVTKYPHPNYSIKEISSFRLVSKSFLETISKLLRTRDVQLKFLDLLLTSQTLPDIKEELVKKKLLLVKLVKLFSSPDHLDGLSVLPFGLRLDACFSASKYSELLEYCLTDCSQSLTSISIEFATNARMPTLNISDIRFPCLQGLTIHWSHKMLQGEEGSELDENSTKDKTMISLQTILDATEKLETFELTCHMDRSSRSFSLIPENLINLQLPKTLKKLDLLGKHFDLLIRSELPKLNILTIDLCRDISPTRINLVSEILEKYKKTLTFLELRDDIRVAEAGYANVMSIILPLMKKLKTLKIRTAGCRVSVSPSLSGLEKCMPILEDVELGVSPMLMTMWMKLLEHSKKKFATIKSLNLAKYIHEEIEIDGEIIETGFVNLNENEVRLTCAAFSNLQRLEVNLNAEGMRFLCRELRHLEVLTVKDYDGGSNAYGWAEMMLGITRDECKRLELLFQESGCTWNDEVLNREENAVSILNLTNLTSFEFQCDELFKDMNHLSYMVFYGGFMKMSRLSDLKLDCYFETTPEMIQEWAEKGTIDSWVPHDEFNDYDDEEEETDSSDDEQENELCSGEEYDDVEFCSGEEYDEEFGSGEEFDHGEEYDHVLSPCEEFVHDSCSGDEDEDELGSCEEDEKENELGSYEDDENELGSGEEDQNELGFDEEKEYELGFGEENENELGSGEEDQNELGFDEENEYEFGSGEEDEYA